MLVGSFDLQNCFSDTVLVETTLNHAQSISIKASDWLVC